MSDCSQAVTLIGCIAERVRAHQAELWLRVCAAMCPQTGSQRYPLQPAPRHPRYDTFPGEVLLRLATARSAGAGQPTGSGALGGDAGAVPARVHVPRPGNRKLQFAVLAVAALRGGTDSRGLRAGVGKHAGNIFSKLGLALSAADHRRMLVGSPLPGALTGDTVGTISLTMPARLCSATAPRWRAACRCLPVWAAGGSAGSRVFRAALRS